MFNFIGSIFKDEPKIRRSVLASVEEAKTILNRVSPMLSSPDVNSLMLEDDISHIAEYLPLIPDDVRVITVSFKEAGLLYRNFMKGTLGFFTIIDDRGVIILNMERGMDYHALILHELIHYEQWKRGDLDITPKGVVWKGEIWPSDHYDVDDEIVKKPWETEAYARTTSRHNRAFLSSRARKTMSNWLKENL